MKFGIVSRGLLSLVFVAVSSLAIAARVQPRADKVEKLLEIHNDVRVDQYYYLKDIKNPNVMNLLKAERAYFDSYFSETDLVLKKTLIEEMKARVELSEESVPVKIQGYWYYTKKNENSNYDIHYRKKDVANAEEELILDENELAKDKEYFVLINMLVSPDGRHVAYWADDVGSGEGSVFIMDLNTKKHLVCKDQKMCKIDKVYWASYAWAPKSDSILYVVGNEAFRPSQAWSYNLQTEKNQILLDEPDELFNVGVQLSADKTSSIISSSSFDVAKNYLLSNGQLETLVPTRDNTIVNLEIYNQQIFALSNHESANYGIYLVPRLGAPHAEWAAVYKAKANSKITGFGIVKGSLIFNIRANALDEIHIFNLAKKKDQKLSWPDKIYGASFEVLNESEQVRIRYSAPFVPTKMFELDLATLKLKILKQDKSPGLIPENYVGKALQIRARDGQLIPAFAYYKKGIKKNGKNPTLLDAYSSYGFTIPVSFDESIFSLLDRGWIYVIAHARGSDAKGTEWYEAGRLKNKTNTFNDVVDVAQALVKTRLTSPKYLALQGASAGGLMVGAVLNETPELFSAAIAGVPFVDTLTTMLDPSIPLTTQEYLQWGNPNIEEDYFYIKSYSPYDNVKRANYPAVLATTGVADQQVGYWESAKWVQKLKDYSTSGREIMLKIDFTGGHSGEPGRYGRYSDLADQYIFLIKETAH